MEYRQILSEKRDDLLLLTLNRPDRMNAWTPRMMAELADAISVANDDDTIGAVVVTGAGRGFCAGADIEANFAGHVDGVPAPSEPGTAGSRDWIQLCRASKPLVGAINGACVGVGLTMMLPFDHLVAAEGAKLSARFVKMGLVPELASSHYLVARCGWGAASWLALTGTTILGEEAARIRLVDRAVPSERVLDDAMAVASEMAANPPPQVRMIKQLLTQNAVESDLTLVQRRETTALEEAYTTPAHHEAVAAFLEKRPPQFR